MARYAIHKSATECLRFYNTNLSPLTIFKASVKAHLKYQYKLYKLRHTQFISPMTSAYMTAARLAQLGERRSAEREVASSNPGRTNTQGL